MLPKPFSTFTTYINHSGFDFAMPSGTLIPALGEGLVKFVGWNRDKPSGDASGPGKNAGNTRIIMYGDVEVRLCHLESLEGPSKGEAVYPGESTGLVGSTGLSTGPHLHMEVWVKGKIQKGGNFWKYVDKTVTAKLSPKMKGLTMIYVRAKNGKAVYAFDPVSGAYNHLTSVEWSAIKAAHKAAGTKPPYDSGTVTATRLVATFGK